MKEENCIFCKIANGEIPSETLFEDEMFRVILDLGPASKGHALILPKQHYKDLCELGEKEASGVFLLAARMGKAMKKSLGCSGFNVVQNNGIEAGQTVFHFHVHLIPRYEGGPVMVSWTPGETSPKDLTQTGVAIRSAL